MKEWESRWNLLIHFCCAYVGTYISASSKLDPRQQWRFYWAVHKGRFTHFRWAGRKRRLHFNLRKWKHGILGYNLRLCGFFLMKTQDLARVLEFEQDLWLGVQDVSTKAAPQKGNRHMEKHATHLPWLPHSKNLWRRATWAVFQGAVAWGRGKHYSPPRTPFPSYIARRGDPPSGLGFRCRFWIQRTTSLCFPEGPCTQ